MHGVAPCRPDGFLACIFPFLEAGIYGKTRRTLWLSGIERLIPESKRLVGNNKTGRLLGGIETMRATTQWSEIVVVPDGQDDQVELAAFSERHMGRVFRLAQAGSGIRLHDIGTEDIVRNKPINITSRSPAPLDLIGNFASTSFELDGQHYASVEAFWQSLKFDSPVDRARIAALSGTAAKLAARDLHVSEVFDYRGQMIRTGTWDHWQLMKRACASKFRQNDDARRALLSTGQRPLVHQLKRDSHTIPGVIMADIWMSLRNKLRQ